MGRTLAEGTDITPGYAPTAENVFARCCGHLPPPVAPGCVLLLAMSVQRRYLPSALAATVLCGTLLSGCSSPPTPQTTANAYLTAWARQDWAAMRQLTKRSAGRLHVGKPGRVQQPDRPPGQFRGRPDAHEQLGGQRAGHRAAHAGRPGHRHPLLRPASRAGTGQVAGEVVAGHDRAAAARRGPAVPADDLAGSRGHPRRGRHAADQPGPGGDDRRRGRPDKGRRLAPVGAGRRGRPRGRG